MIIDLLNKSLSVSSLNPSKDAGGGIVNTPVVRLSSVACALWPATARVVNQYSRPDMIVDCVAMTVTDIAANVDEIVVVDGRTYIVGGYERFDASFAGPKLNITILCKRNQP